MSALQNENSSKSRVESENTDLYKNSMQTFSIEINKGYVTIGVHSMFCNW